MSDAQCQLESIIRDGDPATIYDALRWVVNDPNLGPELARGMDFLIASGGHNESEAVAAADSLTACISAYLNMREAA